MYLRNASRRSVFQVRSVDALAAGATFMAVAFVWPSRRPKDEAEKSLVSSVRFLGKQFLNNPLNVTGLDGATSTPLPSGDALWMFGDTVEGPFKSIRDLDLSQLCSNTAAIVPRQDSSHGIKKFRFLAQPDGKRPRQPVPFVPGEDPAVHRVWPFTDVCSVNRSLSFTTASHCSRVWMCS